MKAVCFSHQTIDLQNQYTDPYIADTTPLIEDTQILKAIKKVVILQYTQRELLYLLYVAADDRVWRCLHCEDGPVPKLSHAAQVLVRHRKSGASLRNRMET